MIATITNTSATTAIAAGSLPFPFDSMAEIAASGNATAALSEEDLRVGEDKGDPAWKRVNDRIHKGEITVAFAAAAGTTVDVLENISRI